MSVFVFIDAEKANHSIKTMCSVLKVSRSGYHAWKRRRPCARRVADAALVERIEAIHDDSNGTYGAPRVHAHLRDDGQRVGRKRVARLMAAHAA